MNPSTIGVDISKDWLDAHRLSDGASRRFANDKAGRRALIKWVSATPAKLVVFEPTGPYHRALERALDAAALPFAKVNPRQARRFAEAAGKLAKTDRADATMLARMGEVLKLEARPCVSRNMADLKELHLARSALVKDRTAARNRAKSLTIALLLRQNAAHLAEIGEKIQEIEAAIKKIIGRDAELARRFGILLSIPGVSEITAFALLIEMPELGSLEGKQAASLAGLAPVARQSGTWKGHAFIQGGRAFLRQALYMPALVASRFNPDLKAAYTRLLKARKPAKVAITAVMRKLLLIANALLRDNRLWSEKTA